MSHDMLVLSSWSLSLIKGGLLSRQLLNLCILQCSIFFIADPKQPFADDKYIDMPRYPNPLNLYMNTPFVVPCQTSSPDLNVTLSCICHVKGPLGIKDGVTFDPQKGFIIENVRESFDGLHVCETTVGNKTFSRLFIFYIYSK